MVNSSILGSSSGCHKQRCMKVLGIAKAINTMWSAESVLNTWGVILLPGGVTYTLGANDRGVTGAWESFVPLTAVQLERESVR